LNLIKGNLQEMLLSTVGCLAIIIIIIIINFSQKTRVTQKAGPANMLPKKGKYKIQGQHTNTKTISSTKTDKYKTTLS